MITELEARLPSFRGEKGRVRCFAHILNLAAKAVLRQFDVAKGKEGDATDTAEAELRELMAGVDLEDVEGDWNAEDNDEEDEGTDDEDMPNLVADMSDEELEELAIDVRPAKFVLAKARV